VKDPRLTGFAMWSALQNAALQIFSPSSAFGAPALIGAVLFAALYYADRRTAKGRRPSLAGFVRVIFPKRLLLHPSTRIDMRMWLLNGVALASFYALLSGGLFFWRDVVDGVLVKGLGPRSPEVWPAWTVLALATVLQILAYEFAYWCSHLALHRIPALWEFHKVHHSAEVMTVFTELRQHPIEILIVANSVGLATGLVFGILTYVFGPGVKPFTLIGGNILTMAFLFTYGHLRHSSMWIPFTGALGKILHSPAHHQLHHSDDPIHFGKNLGFALSVWDFAFGTLVVPRRQRERIVFGVGDDAAFRSVIRGWIVPFARAGRRLA
jgi:sterol desaturase/sphingolipid hydroxylase (fatty acid hydroxylase superfamily)